MGFRFWRRVKIAPGVTLNLSKSGASVSVGPRGAKFTVGPGGKRATVGLPGTGLFYTTLLGGKKGRERTPSRRESPSDDGRLDMGFFKRLVTPDDEEALVDGCRELASGNEDAAFERLREAAHLPDGAYLAGILALKRGELEEADRFLSAARRGKKRLNEHFGRYGVAATMELPVTAEVAAVVGPEEQGVLLALVEVYQLRQEWQKALDCVERLLVLDSADAVVRLSWAELLMDARPGDGETCRKVVDISQGVENDSPVHATLLLYRAKALRCLGILEGARDVLSLALRRKKDRSEDLVLALRYERAGVYEDLGQNARARSDLEKIYAQEPDYEDVAFKLGIR